MLTPHEQEQALSALRTGAWDDPVLDKVKMKANNQSGRKPKRGRRLLHVLHRLATQDAVTTVEMSKICIGWERNIRALRALGFGVAFTPHQHKEHGLYRLSTLDPWVVDVTVSVDGQTKVVPVTVYAKDAMHAVKAAPFKAVTVSVVPDSARKAA